MYLSHAVRTIRDDPMADESVELVVTLADEVDDADESAAGTTGREAFDSAVVDLGGEVVADLQFSAVRVRLPERAVADLCALDGIDRIETTATLSLAGEETTEPVSGTDNRGTDDTTPTPDHDRDR